MPIRGADVEKTLAGRNLFGKIWDRHRICSLGDGRDLIFVDRHLLQETTSAVAFDGLAKDKRSVAAPSLHLRPRIILFQPNCVARPSAIPADVN